MNYAWDIFRQYAPYNPHLADFNQFEYFIERLKSKQSFHIARYNDGEWIVALQIEPHYTYCVTTHMHNFEEVGDISKKMLSVIDSKPPYFIGIDSTTLALSGSISLVKETFLNKIKSLNVVYGEVFNAATVMFGIDILIKPLLDRWVLTVGPEYMQKLKISEHHINVPLHNCWNQSDQIQNQIQAILTCNLDKNPVVVYSCSLLAKWLIDVFYKQFGDSITQLDVGSCIDPWCGIVSRPWHNALLQTYGLHGSTKPGKHPQYGYPQYGYTRNLLITPSTPDPKPKSKPEQPKAEMHRDPNTPIVLPASISTGKPAPRSGFK